MTFVLLFLSLAFAQNQNACSQHNPMSPDVPACPTTGSTLLSENFPIMAATVSDREGGAQYVKEYVTKVLKAQPDKPPQFFLHVTPETYESVVAELRSQAPSPQVAEQWIKGLSRVESGLRWNWQQDYFESFFDPDTGKPVLREVQGYERHGDSFTRMIGQTQRDCSINQGPLLENNGFKSGHSGGNLEAVNGLCIVGSDHFTESEWGAYAKSTCTRPSTAVKAPSDFLKVGHTDEMFKTLKDPSQSPPCDFSLAFASPKKGLEVLKANPEGKAFNFPNTDTANIVARMRQGTYREICTLYIEMKRRENPTNRKSPGSPGPKKGISQFLFELGLPQAQAGAEGIDELNIKKLMQEYQGLSNTHPTTPEERQRLEEKRINLRNRIRASLSGSGYVKAQDPIQDVQECAGMTNRDLAKVIESSSETKDFNEAIEKSIQDFKKDLLAKLKSKYPQCTPKTVDMPDIFLGMMDYDKKPATYAKGSAESLFPNPTNGEIVGTTYIMPEPVNPAFKKELDSQVKELGLKTDYIDTHFAHIRQGNLHCSSHAMRYCRPQGGAR